MGDYEGAARTQMKLGQTYHSAFDYQRANKSYKDGFSLWKRASEKQSGDPYAFSSHALKLTLSQDPYTLDPGLAFDNLSSDVIIHLFSGLLEYTPEMDVLPDVAKNWEILEGGRRYIFYLREDTHWSDGTPVTAEDFVYAWRRVLNPANQAGTGELLYDIKGARAFHQGETSDIESLGIRAIDPYTLEVELDEPAGYFLQLMAHSTAYPIPHHVVEVFLGEEWTDRATGSQNGPFLAGELAAWKVNDPGCVILITMVIITGNVQRVEITIYCGQRRG